MDLVINGERGYLQKRWLDHHKSSNHCWRSTTKPEFSIKKLVNCYDCFGELGYRDAATIIQSKHKKLGTNNTVIWSKNGSSSSSHYSSSSSTTLVSKEMDRVSFADTAIVLNNSYQNHNHSHHHHHQQPHRCSNRSPPSWASDTTSPTNYNDWTTETHPNLNSAKYFLRKCRSQSRFERHHHDENHLKSSANLMMNRWFKFSQRHFTTIWSLLFILVIVFVDPVFGRHYIAPGPCTWTHLVANTANDLASSNRDNRFKSTSSSAASLALSLSPSSTSNLPSSLLNELASQQQQSSTTNEFDVSLRCSVPALTPYTLNISMIDAQHTVKLAIQCQNNNDFSDDSDYVFGSPVNGGKNTFVQQRSTLRPSPHQPLMGPFEHLRSLSTLSIDNCKLDHLPSDTFRGLVSLKNLTIRNAVFSQQEPFIIELHSFRHVENHLEHLDFGFNQISALPSDLFCPFVVLHTLNLTYNNLQDLASFGLIDPATGRLCLQELQLLDLSHNRLEFVPETSGVAALKNLQYLNLSSNQITEIAELAFSALRRLYVLDLSGNQLRTVPSRMFRDSDELRELRLANNGLIELPSGLFTGLSKLLVLDISGNQITSDTIGQDTFADMIRVLALDLSNNRLRQIHSLAFHTLYSLQVLSLEGNDLETIGEGAFTQLYNLHTLKLGRNRFRLIHENALNGLFVLNTLQLNHNQLEHIHDEAFKNCTNLQNLDISHNRLTSVPNAIRSLHKLHRLSLASNKFVMLAEAGFLMHVVSTLRVLDLSDNYLVNVTRSAFRPISGSLQELRLDGNRLRSLEKNTLDDLRQTLRVLRLDRNEFADVSTALVDIKQLEKLEVLNVSRNHISWFDYALIPTALRALDLSSNRIDLLGNYYELEAQLRLEDLDVSFNQIKEIGANSIPNSIRRLNLRANRIEKIDQFAFVAKHNVTFVDIRNNSLRRIDNNAFRLGVQRPTSSYFLNRNDFNNHGSDFDGKYLPPPMFFISGNPYYCDCTMEWLQRVNQLVGGVTGSGAISTYPRIGDLDQVVCDLPFTRQSSLLAKSMPESMALSANEGSVASIPSPSGSAGNGPSGAVGGHTTPSVTQSLIPPVSSFSSFQKIGLLQANSSNFLCRYRSHCFALCHCCEFDACDCEMMCPENCTCYYDQTWNTNIVDCSGANYRQVPTRIPMDVTSLFLDGNYLNFLTAHTFIGRKNLRILHLNNSQLESISNRSFNGLVYLEELHLQHNHLTALYGYEFETLHYLTTLQLDNNQISFINEKTFQSLRSLQVLKLNNNQLNTFGSWFSPSSILAVSPTGVSSNTMMPNRQLLIALSSNPWTCHCQSISILYDTVRQAHFQLNLMDGSEIRCQNGSSISYYLFEESGHRSLLERCNLSDQHKNSWLPSLIAAPSTTLPPTSSVSVLSEDNHKPMIEGPPSRESSNNQQPEIQAKNNFRGGIKVSVDQGDDENNSNNPNNNVENDDGDMLYQPIDPSRPKLLPPINMSRPSDIVTSSVRDQNEWMGSAIPSSASSSPNSILNLLWLLFIISSVSIVLFGLLFLSIRHKQDIQLWFYGRYGVRLFESGFCCASGGNTGTSQRRNRNNGRNGFNDNYVRDSEKLFDAFVIYARSDESFVTQQLAAELECGYPPYRLCLRYRDLPVPSIDTSNPNGTLSKDHGYAFDAVTQAIECSRRTVVVISENFVQSEWCKFELKAAHQETMASCKTHRLIVVIVPNLGMVPLASLNTPSHNNNNNNNNVFSATHHVNHHMQAQSSPQLLHQTMTPTKAAELLLQRLDSETKTCIRGVTILTWGERRFWEKLRFSMPASSAAASSTTVPVCDNSVKSHRTSTVVVTNCGYPTLAPSTLSSSSSLARSSVLYDTTTQPIYYQQQNSNQNHHYHYAQLPPSNASLHKSTSLSIFKQQLNGSMPTIRNPFNSKPLPPPPNQPLPPLPLVVSGQYLGHHIQQSHQQQSSITDSLPPTYASCSEFGGTSGTEYGESIQAESSILSNVAQHQRGNNPLLTNSHRSTLTPTHSHISAYQQQAQQQHQHHNNPMAITPQHFFTGHNRSRAPL